MSSRPGFTKSWLVTSNLVTALAWLRVLLTVATNFFSLQDAGLSVCSDALTPATHLALWISLVEIFNCLTGFTRSPLPAVLLFSGTRLGVEKLVAPSIPCGSWQHLLTVSCWSLGDTIRFGTFAVNTADPNIVAAKSLRFTVGPVLFPIGAFGEMTMVVAAASEKGQPGLYIAAALWPVFFYPMMQQLLKQRRKHFSSGEKKKQIKAV